MSCALWPGVCARRTAPCDRRGAWSVKHARQRGSLTMKTPLALGEITIHPVVEQQGAFFDALGFFPKLTKEQLDENRHWLQPEFVDSQDRLGLCIQSFVIKTPRHNIPIDARVGNPKPRPPRPFWSMLGSQRVGNGLAGRGAAAVDTAMRAAQTP